MEFSDYVTQHLESFALRPRMHGSPETVESMALMLIELEVLHYYPHALEKYPRIAIDAYLVELSRATGFSATPLSSRPEIKNMEGLLRVICTKARRRILFEIPKLGRPAVTPSLFWARKNRRRRR